MLLALFIPAVVYMADAVGTQTETVVIRGLSAGVGVGDVVRRELASGLAIGAIVAAAFFSFVAAVWGDVSVAVAVRWRSPGRSSGWDAIRPSARARWRPWCRISCR